MPRGDGRKYGEHRTQVKYSLPQQVSKKLKKRLADWNSADNMKIRSDSGFHQPGSMK